MATDVQGKPGQPLRFAGHFVHRCDRCGHCPHRRTSEHHSTVNTILALRTAVNSPTLRHLSHALQLNSWLRSFSFDLLAERAGDYRKEHSPTTIPISFHIHTHSTHPQRRDIATPPRARDDS